jgi:hypothetical protein
MEGWSYKNEVCSLIFQILKLKNSEVRVLQTGFDWKAVEKLKMREVRSIFGHSRPRRP